MEYLIVLKNISQVEESSVNILEYVEKGLSFANSLLALVVIVIGLSWLKPLREKQQAASFSFWSQLRIRLITIQDQLRANDMCLYYLYAPIVRDRWDGELAPEPKDFCELKDSVAQTLNFLQGAEDQMPPYSGWTKEYTKLLEYLTDIVAFDVCNPNKKFKYKDETEIDSPRTLCNDICELIKSICSKIEDKQLLIESKLTIAWHRRSWDALKQLMK